jgi:DNA-binding NarL/FixJ family response regulator
VSSFAGLPLGSVRACGCAGLGDMRFRHLVDSPSGRRRYIPTCRFDAQRLRMRVLMIDDHLMFLQGLKSLLRLLAPEWHIDVVDTADGALRMAATCPYDLMLLDWHLPDHSGAGLIGRLRDVGCASRIVVLSGETGAEAVLQMMDAGAAGYIPKRYTSERMLQALDTVIQGGIYLPPEALAGRGTIERSGHELVEAEQRLSGLTPRQVDVYRAAARGLPNKLIARELGIAESTVKTHLCAIYALLGVRNRTEAAYQASAEGIRIG